jgi:GTP-binding protein
MKYYNLDVTIVATKFDKVKTRDKEKNEKYLREAFDIKGNDNIVLFSSVTKKGREEVYQVIANAIDTN